jgi:hypothetical protein
MAAQQNNPMSANVAGAIILRIQGVVAMSIGGNTAVLENAIINAQVNSPTLAAFKNALTQAVVNIMTAHQNQPPAQGEEDVVDLMPLDPQAYYQQLFPDISAQVEAEYAATNAAQWPRFH